MTPTQLKKLQADGKIRGFNIAGKIAKPAPRSKALGWLNHELKKWTDLYNYELLKEHQFHPVRKFRFDFSIVNLKVAIEYEGGIFLKKSGHNTATHYTKDAEKYNLAVIMGWKVLRYTALNYRNVLKDLHEMERLELLEVYRKLNPIKK